MFTSAKVMFPSRKFVSLLPTYLKTEWVWWLGVRQSTWVIRVLGFILTYKAWLHFKDQEVQYLSIKPGVGVPRPNSTTK